MDWEQTDALPRNLSKYLEKVPFYIDFTRLARIEDLTLRDPDFKQGVNAITARFRNIDPNEMLGVEIAQYRRNLRLRNGALIALLALGTVASIAAGVAAEQRQDAQRNLARAYESIGDSHWARREALNAEIAYARALIEDDRRETREKLLEVRSRGVSSLWRSVSRLGGSALAYSPATQCLVVGHHDFTVGVWDMSKCCLVRRLTGHSSPITALAVSPDGKLVASGDQAGRLNIWEVATGTRLMVTEVSARFTSMAFVRSSWLIAVIAGNRLLRWDIGLVSPISERQIDGDDVSAVVFDSDASKLIIGDRKGMIRVIDPFTCEQVNALSADQIPIGKMALNSEGNLLATWSDITGLAADPSSMRVRILDLWTNKLVQGIPGSFGYPGALAFSPDSRTLAIGQIADAFVLCDIQEKSPQVIKSGGIRALTFAPGQQLITVGEGFNVWGLEAKEPIRFSGHSSSVQALAVQ